MNKIEELDLRQQLIDVTNERNELRTQLSKLADDYCKRTDELIASEARNAELSIYESFPCYLIDHCEGATVYEESLQHWLAEHIMALARSAPATDEQGAGS